jgi:hypothetical protein
MDEIFWYLYCNCKFFTNFDGHRMNADIFMKIKSKSSVITCPLLQIKNAYLKVSVL